MKKAVSKRRLIFVFAWVLLLGLTLFACKKTKDEGIKTSDLNGFDSVIEDGALSVEWLNDYQSDRPLLVVFHGEREENNIYSFDLSKEVYNAEVTDLNETINAGTIGYKALGLKEKDGKYNILYYWTNIAKYNVAVVHAEKFLCESPDDIATKLYSTYKSRYYKNGEAVDCDFGYSLSEVIAAYLSEQMEGKGVGTQQIRFVGNGTGANLALSTAYSLFESNRKGYTASAFLPARVTLCDPYLSAKELPYSVSLPGNFIKEKGVIGVVAEMTSSLSAVAFEWIQTDEVGGEKVYPGNATSGESFDRLKNSVVSLTLSESYSLKPSYASYRNEKRIALDWYLYSVVGSDDSYTRSSGDNTYAIGNPHTQKEYDLDTFEGANNWDPNARRPILNERAFSNDYSVNASKSQGLNFAVGAWTPTPYMYAMKGQVFTQKDAVEDTKKKDVFGHTIYRYENYVLSTFKSENYQYCDWNDTIVVTGRVYYDENGDGIMNDGVNNGIHCTIYLTVETNTGTVLAERVKAQTDENGYYYIVLHQKNNDSLSFTLSENGGVVRGFDNMDSMVFGVMVYMSEGYKLGAEAKNGIWYENVEKNNFSQQEYSFGVSHLNAHSAVIKNCLLIKE